MPFISQKKLDKLVFDLSIANSKASRLENTFMIEDFFLVCQDCDSNGTKRRLIDKNTAKSFEILEDYSHARWSPFGLSYYSQQSKRIKTVYTSKENYENHKPLIDKYAKEVKEFRDKSKMDEKNSKNLEKNRKKIEKKRKDFEKSLSL